MNMLAALVGLLGATLTTDAVGQHHPISQSPLVTAMRQRQQLASRGQLSKYGWLAMRLFANDGLLSDDRILWFTLQEKIKVRATITSLDLPSQVRVDLLIDGFRQTPTQDWLEQIVKSARLLATMTKTSVNVYLVGDFNFSLRLAGKAVPIEAVYLGCNDEYQWWDYYDLETAILAAQVTGPVSVDLIEAQRMIIHPPHS